jgi:hypothetical protein
LNPLFAKVKPLHFVVEEHNFIDKLLRADESISCVIMTEHLLRSQVKVSEFCRTRGIPFIACGATGGYAWAYNDFGGKTPARSSPCPFPPAHSISMNTAADEFIINDANGEKPAVVLISHIRHCLSLTLLTIPLCFFPPHSFALILWVC